MKYLNLFFCLFLMIGLQSQCPTDYYLEYDQDDIDAFANNYPDCTSIDGRLIISGAHDLSGLSQLRGISGSLIIRNSKRLKTLDGLDNIIFVGGNIQISNNDSLVALYAFNQEEMKSIGGELSFLDNPMLTTLEAFQYLENIYAEGEFAFAGLWFFGNPALIHVDELSNLKNVNKDISFFGSLNLESVEGLSNIQNIPLDLNIHSSPKLKSLQGLHNLQSVGGNISLYDLGVENLDALYSLTEVGGAIEIESNPFLTQIEGLSGIDPNSLQGDREGYSEYLEVAFNPVLNICASEFLCGFLERQDITHYIKFNAEGCNSVDEINENCSSVSTFEFQNKISSIYPNPAQSFVYIKSTKLIQTQLLDLQGRIVRSMMLLPGINEVDISELESGRYILALGNGESHQILKL